MDSSATHSFVYPHVVSSTSAAMSKVAKLTITVAIGSKVVGDNVVENGLVFTIQGNKIYQVTTAVKLYVLYGLFTDLIVGMDFLQG